MIYRKKQFQLSPPQILAFGFILIIMTGTLLLMLPIASRNEPVSFIDALFTATSAACVTGLVVVDTATQFTMFGHIVIAILIQIGGLGFITMATLFALILKKRISLRERLVLQQALNQLSLEGIVRLIRKIIIYSFIIEGAGAFLLAVRWSFDMPLGQAIFFGIFHAISVFNNACFDLVGGFRSFTPYADDIVINLVSMVLIVLGGLGFIVLADFADYKKKRRLSLHTKVVLSVSACLILFGALVIFALEYNNPFTLRPLSPGVKVMASFFQSVTPRSAGASTLDIGHMTQASQFFLILLMFIGASPVSTGGGIKTTTFAILLGAMFAMIRGKRDVVLFRYRLSANRVYKAVTLTLMALFLVIVVSMVLAMTEPYPFLMILFEVTSAFATAGLTMGLTAELTPFGKVMIILTMFIGRLGPLTLAYALGSKLEKELYRHPEGHITIG